jgi:beta-aspartyl-peptidase (threonine type)
MLGAVAAQLAARVEFAGAGLADAAGQTLEREVTGRGAFGGLIAVDAAGGTVIAWDAQVMLCAYGAGDSVVTLP